MIHVVAWSLLLGFVLLIVCAELPSFMEGVRRDVERGTRRR